MNRKRPKYDYSMTEANNNQTKEKVNDIDNEMRMYTEIDHFNFLNSFAQVKERKQSSSKAIYNFNRLERWNYFL